MRNLTLLLALAATLALSACGFQLRGSRAPVLLPFATLYIALPSSSELHAALKRGVEASGKTRVIEDPKSAQVALTLTGDTQAKNVLSLDTSGRVREFQLRYRFAFRVHDAKGRDIVPLSEIVLTREISFSDAQLLAKEQEEILLFRDMQNDLVQQLMRRLAAAKIPG